MDTYLPLMDEAALIRERARAREIRASQWWKRKRSTGICHYCRHRFPPADLTMDHMIPLGRGGRSERFNLVPCCKDCNTQKKNLLPAEWDGYMARLRK
jgi:5-methylcytosine-specific restriction endonuclease McrA